MKVAKQTTLRDHTALCGVGIHSGLPVTLTLHPADADTGLRFIRTHVDVVVRGLLVRPEDTAAMPKKKKAGPRR